MTFLGTAHLEALEELSRWSSDTLGKQLSCLKGKPSDAVHDDLALINESFYLGDFSDLMDGVSQFASSHCNSSSLGSKITHYSVHKVDNTLSSEAMLCTA